ncbi:MAG: S26 family signal peptidase [Christensenellaceae bacterium]
MDKNQGSVKTVRARLSIIAECLIIAFCIVISAIVISNPGEIGKDGNAKTLFLPVKTDSMEPTIKSGSLIKTRKPDSDIIDLGTVVTFVVYSTPNYLDTHRIVGYRYYDKNGDYHVEYYKNGEMESASDFYAKYKDSGYTIDSYVTRGDKYTVLYGDEKLLDLGYSKDNSTPESSVTYYDDLPYVSFSQVVALYDFHISGVGGVLLFIMKPVNFFVLIIIPLLLLFCYNVYDIIRTVVTEKMKKQAERFAIDEEEIKRRAIEEYLSEKGLNADENSENEQKKEDDKC